MKYFVVIVLIIVGIVAGIFTVDERESAVITYINKNQKLYLPGTYITIPWLNRIDYIYIGQRHSLLELPQVLTTKDGVKINLAVLINWKVSNPIDYLKATQKFNEVELNSKIAQSVIKIIQTVVIEHSLTSLNQVTIFNNQAIILESYGLTINKITLENLRYYIDIKSDKTNLTKSLNLLTNNSIDPSIESAYLQAQAIKTETEIEEAKLYTQIKNKDPKFYNYFRTIDIYTRTAKSKEEIPPLKKLFH